VLRVTASDRGWLQEIERSQSLIRARLDGLLGPGIVRTIRIDSCTTR